METMEQIKKMKKSQNWIKMNKNGQKLDKKVGQFRYFLTHCALCNIQKMDIIEMLKTTLRSEVLFLLYQTHCVTSESPFEGLELLTFQSFMAFIKKVGGDTHHVHVSNNGFSFETRLLSSCEMTLFKHHFMSPTRFWWLSPDPPMNTLSDLAFFTNKWLKG